MLKKIIHKKYSVPSLFWEHQEPFPPKIDFFEHFFPLTDTIITSIGTRELWTKLTHTYSLISV